MATRAECDDRSERAGILAEAIAGGREALRRQAARHAPRRADADDILQEACVEFLRYYEGEPGEHALRYLMVAVKHRAWANSSDPLAPYRYAVTAYLKFDGKERSWPRTPQSSP